MNVRFKKTDKGEIAILPRKEYEALAAKAAEADEDIGSARLVARARKEIAAGAPLIPKNFVDRIANGENALRVLREWREMTQLYLSSKTDIGQGYISDLESGRRKGTTAALKKIADAMNVPLDLLVEIWRLRRATDIEITLFESVIANTGKVEHRSLRPPLIKEAILSDRNQSHPVAALQSDAAAGSDLGINTKSNIAGRFLRLSTAKYQCQLRCCADLLSKLR